MTPAAPVSSGSAARAARPTQQLRERIAKLRQDNEDLHLHVELYEERTRRLSIENDRMSKRLAELSNITILDHHRKDQRRAGTP